MNSPSDGIEPAAKVAGLFATTHWSVVLTAGQSESPQAAQALETLCRTYWYPLYAC
jgi:RNA polymerase sigma-70 factor (ECF subfamily)